MARVSPILNFLFFFRVISLPMCLILKIKMPSLGVFSLVKRLPNPPSLKRLVLKHGRYFEAPCHIVFILLLTYNITQEEAFDLWTEWEEEYPPNSKSQLILHDIGERYWLVNVVHNDFQKPDLLFDVMLS